MAEIRKIPNPLQNPQPVGGSGPSRPDEKTGEDFQEVLRRKRRKNDETDQDGSEQFEDGESGNEERGESAPQPDDERGILLDERA